MVLTRAASIAALSDFPGVSMTTESAPWFAVAWSGFVFCFFLMDYRLTKQDLQFTQASNQAKLCPRRHETRPTFNGQFSIASFSEPMRGTDGRGRGWKDRRTVLNGIAWVRRVGAPWAEFPDGYSAYQTSRRFQHRRANTRTLGHYARVFTHSHAKRGFQVGSPRSFAVQLARQDSEIFPGTRGIDSSTELLTRFCRISGCKR